ncbi:MAG: site-2 protease family protein [Acidobacteria bacterium]|nr:site-2 protease family protein [Acidobacteriota bacterium]
MDFGALVLWLAVLLFSLSIHESSHAWVADHFGDYTARYLGRVSLNPLAHIDPLGTLIFPIFAYLTGIPLIGWAKPVPVNAVHLRNPRRDQVFISAAGPLSNLLAGLGFLVLLKIVLLTWGQGAMQGHSVLTPLSQMLYIGVVLNFLLAIFNLIPIPPLDGSGVIYGLLPHEWAERYDRIRPYGMLLLFALLWTDVLRVIFQPIQMLIRRLIWV